MPRKKSPEFGKDNWKALTTWLAMVHDLDDAKFRESVAMLADAVEREGHAAHRSADALEAPFYDWKEGVTGKTQPETVGRLYERFKLDEDLYWERYGRRSLAESGMHAVKQRFGYTLSSRAKPAQFAEVMLRLICHNVAQLIMAVQEFEVDPRYWAKELIAKLPDLGSTQPRGVELARLGEKVTEEDEVQ